MIAIDFVPGTHGHFLEYVCNRFLSDMPPAYTTQLPFDDMGTAHNTSDRYRDNKFFQSAHYYLRPDIDLAGQDLVSIEYTAEDLLPIIQICFLRAGNINIDTDALHVNTYHKLDRPEYRLVLDNLISTFGDNLCDSYNAVKDPGWPQVCSLADYHALPAHIKQECEQQHHLKIVHLSAQDPDCPRSKLREFFKLSFREPQQDGFMQLKSRRCYPGIKRTFHWRFDTFYRWDLFLQEITRLAAWLPRDLSDLEALQEVHQEFVCRQPYAHSRHRCQGIIGAVLTGQDRSCHELNLVEQAYVDAQLELQFGREMPTDRVEYFATTQEIKEYIAHGR